jgi:hypothetical protein
MPSPRTAFDAIVVGTGPGGAAVARDLTLAGKEVLMLEWGDYNPIRGSAIQTIPQALIPGKGLTVTSELVSVVRGITTGGSSIFYCGTAFAPPVDMLKAYGIDISAEAEEVRGAVPIAELSDELMGAGPNRFLDSARDLGYDARKLTKFIHQNKCRSKCALCSYGCPYGAKWNARHFVDEAVENGAKIINHAKATRAILHNKKAVGVEYRQDRQTHRAYASTVIIAAGGIGSPLILRESGVRSAGFDFFFDPLIYVYGKIKGIGNGKSIPMSAGVHFADDGIVMTDFNMPHLMKIAFDLQVFKFKQAFSYRDTLPIMIKIRDDLSGELTRGGG